jgi:uncharacterized membrane protein YoaK (UPF0700 family)
MFAFHYLRRLACTNRNERSDRHLGYALAFAAGAINAGGFLAIGQYTSHMSGIVSTMADDLALGQMHLALAALAALLAFMLGSAMTAVLINWAKRRQLRSRYALALLFESSLLLLFGLAGANMATMRDFLAPITVLLLCFIMGMQNATITKVSGAVIRTTHVTGLCTDLGIELGKLIFYNRRHLDGLEVRANRNKLKMYALLIACFFIGGISGALGFKHIGYSATIILAAELLLLAIGPVVDDLVRGWKRS